MSIKSIMTALANAVRSKTGTTGQLTLQGMADALVSSCTEITPGLIDRSIATYTIPSNVTSIGGTAFTNCRSLTSIVIPSSVTSIASYAFNVCGSLTSVTIPYGVMSIGDRAFNLCSRLPSVIIPSSVTKIASDTFHGCSSLTDIYCGFAEGVVSGAPWGADNATIHYNSNGPA